MQRLMICGALAALTACQPAVPDSALQSSSFPNIGSGVGFNTQADIERARAEAARREAALQSPTVFRPPNPFETAGAAGPTTQLSAPPPQRRVTSAQATPNPVPTRSTVPARDPELVDIEARADAQARAQNSGQAVVNASPGNAAPVILDNPGISREQDFDSVSSRRSIDADAARIATNRAQREEIQPTALPTRRGADQPNIVAYALQTTHPVGTRVHRRVSLSSAAKTRRNCAVFANDDEAQIEFLATGGPQRDRKALDPDGDGYACGWDPAPFRRVGG